MRLRSPDAAALLLIGAAGGLIGDAAHVETATTGYLDRGVPFIWNSALWFPVAVGLGTLAIGEIRLRLPGSLEPLGPREFVAAISAVIAIYCLTAVVSGFPESVSTSLVASVSVVAVAWLVRTRADLICGMLAATAGPLAEIAIVAADVSRYAPSADGLAGVAVWLVPLYLAFGVAVARLASTLATGSLRIRAPR